MPEWKSQVILFVLIVLAIFAYWWIFVRNWK